MSRFAIRHETRYAYERPVRFEAQRLMVRPRDSHAIRVWDARLTLSPPGETRWFYDALGNSVCAFTPQGEATGLTIVSELTIERFPAPLDVKVDDPQTATPIVYHPADRAVLAPFMSPVSVDIDGQLLAWLRRQVESPHEPALDFLLRLNRTIHRTFAYQPRHEGEARAPCETARLMLGSCRDLAWLMAEALRMLGYAARFVTGYLHSPGGEAVRGAGATHAWCEVFLPSLGWTGFDPTNALAESACLIPVAVARTPAEAAPVSGQILGDPGRVELSVHVDVRPAQSLPEAA
jgi:YD repeat-containing protein